MIIQAGAELSRTVEALGHKRALIFMGGFGGHRRLAGVPCALPGPRSLGTFPGCLCAGVDRVCDHS